MICDPCKKGDHPVKPKDCGCPCQHRPKGAWKGDKNA